MFTPDISLSLPATTRWKKSLLTSTDSKFSIAEVKNLRRLINSRDASKFLSISATPGLTGSKVSKNEDLREISIQLVSLKKKHDVNKSLNFRNQFSLDKEIKQVQKFKQVKNIVLETNQKIASRVKNLEKMCEEVKTQQEEALEARKVYKHILNRMRANKIFIDEQNFELNCKLKENNLALNEEEYRKVKMKELNIQTKEAFSALKEYVSVQTVSRMEQLEIVKKDAEQQIKNTENRGIRMKRQVDIAEDAADEERNNKAMQVRESLMIHRIFYFLQDVKMQMSKKRFAVIDEAFRKIKHKYGHMEPVEMIEKVLTREQTFTDLLTGISFSRERIGEQTEKNLMIMEKIDVLNANKSLNESNKQWKKILNKIYKETSADNEKLRNLRIIKDKILFWVKKLLERLGVQSSKSTNLVHHLQGVKENIMKLLKKDGPRIRKSIIAIDNMTINQVLKIFGEQKNRRNTFSMIPAEEIDKIIRELSIQDEQDSSQKKLLS